jgi:hypothetical protein
MTEEQMQQIQKERRYQAGRPYHRPRNRYEVSETSDRIFAFIVMHICSAIAGAVVMAFAIKAGWVLL